MALNIQKMLGTTEVCGDLPCEKELLSNTVKMAWPAITENFLICIVTMVDTMMVGSLGASAIAAVGLTTQPRFIALAFFLSFNIAVSSTVARRFGERKILEVNKILTFAILFTIALCIFVSSIFIYNIEFVISIMKGEPETNKLAVEYFSIIIMGLFFTVGSLVINAVQRGVGNTKVTMRTNIVANLVNVVLNFLLIGGNFGFPALGVRGAAIATVVGSVCALAMSVLSVSKKGEAIYLWKKENIGISKDEIRTLIKLGIPSLAEQMFQRIGFILYAMTVSSLGTVAFAAQQIGMNICTMAFSVGEGISFAAIALVGKSLGEKRPDLAKVYGSVCQKIGFVCSCFFSLVILVFGRALFGLFTNDPGVLVYATPISLILCVITLLQISSSVYGGCLRAGGDASYIAMVSLVSIAIVRPFASYVFVYPLGYGLIGAWIGFSIDQVLRFIFTYTRFSSGKWVKIKL